jgi:hypothetical protein
MVVRAGEHVWLGKISQLHAVKEAPEHALALKFHHKAKRGLGFLGERQAGSKGACKVRDLR